MELTFCPACEHKRGFKRDIGIGTLIAVIGTAGLWLVAIPLYPKRCIVCGYPWDYAIGKAEEPEE